MEQFSFISVTENNKEKSMKTKILFFATLLIFASIIVNSTEADKTEKSDSKKSGDKVTNMNHKKATFGAGCFWGVEAIFQKLDGVVETSVGYMGGNTKNPTYKEICYEETNHAEVCEITYDPNVISYTDLLSVFFSLHDPTTLNRQGPDVGTQYRSAIFYNDDDQKARAINALQQIEDGKLFNRPVVTEVTEALTYYKAEDYHQDYFLNKNIAPHCGIGVVNVKLNEMK